MQVVDFDEIIHSSIHFMLVAAIVTRVRAKIYALEKFENYFTLFNPVSFIPPFIADMPGTFAMLSE